MLEPGPELQANPGAVLPTRIDPEQCGLTLHGSHLHADVFINKYTGKSFGDMQQSLKNLIVFFSLRIQYVIHMTYKMCINQLCYWLPVNSRPLVEVLKSQKL